MSTTIKPEDATSSKSSIAAVIDEHDIQEIRLYSHSDVFYWWPVWAMGFFLALLTYLDGGLMAVVPEGTIARRDWRIEVAPGQIESGKG